MNHYDTVIVGAGSAGIFTALELIRQKPSAKIVIVEKGQPIEYAKKVGELTNMLGAGYILVQRYGDILDGKRIWPKELSRSNVRPSLPDAEAGDITAAMPYRAMINIINFIQAVDEVVPGFASEETLMYSPKLKFYSNRVKMDADFCTNVKGLHCLGDSSGWIRGLMMASVMGALMGRKLACKDAESCAGL